MKSSLTAHQLAHFRRRLKDRFYALRSEISQELLQSDDESYQKLAGEVHDLEEQAMADLLVDLNLADIDRDIEEIRDIDAALMRISNERYGVCVDCQGTINIERLNAFPTAKRCLQCQKEYERTHRKSAATTR